MYMNLKIYNKITLFGQTFLVLKSLRNTHQKKNFALNQDANEIPIILFCHSSNGLSQYVRKFVFKRFFFSCANYLS